MHPVEIHAMDSCMAQISKDRKIKRLQDIGNPMIRQPGDVFLCLLNIHLLVNTERVVLGNITTMECIELCRLLTGHVAWMDEQLGDLRLEAILGAILCTCYGEWTAFEKEKAAMVQQWNALENLSSLDTWKWIYGTRQRVENMLGRVQILTSVFDIFHSTESTNANILVENVQDWEKCVKEKQSVIQITLEAAMQKTFLVQEQLAYWKEKLDRLAQVYAIGNAAFDARMWSLDLAATIVSVSFAFYGMISQFFGYYVQLPIYNMGNASQYYFYGIVSGIIIALSLSIYFSLRWFIRHFRQTFYGDAPLQ